MCFKLGCCPGLVQLVLLDQTLSHPGSGEEPYALEETQLLVLQLQLHFNATTTLITKTD